MSDNVVHLFTARGVTFLFPIQAKTFHHVYSGKDLIAQARTGTGKTFSFAIPLVEKLQGELQDRKRGRAPQVSIFNAVLRGSKSAQEETLLEHHLHTLLFFIGFSLRPFSGIYWRSLSEGKPG